MLLRLCIADTRASFLSSEFYALLGHPSHNLWWIESLEYSEAIVSGLTLLHCHSWSRIDAVLQEGVGQVVARGVPPI